MTTEEARTKWCPMVRSTVVNLPSSNRDWSGATGGIVCNNNPEYARCIADECACWVWDRKTEHSYGPVKHLPKEQWQGRCGLSK